MKTARTEPADRRSIMIRLQKYLFGDPEATMPYDLDNNGKTDIRDLIVLKEKIIAYNSL